MKNLQSFGVQELTKKEVKQTNGGIFIIWLFRHYGAEAGASLERAGFNSAGANK
ncbi:hypothetical protein [Tenacibaculum ovolyticum]|uniref:hypothetical protein n=1 Tax=Tenacibaculum ovolyticum TaxID=104270 RepID=UPI000A54ACA3|nr:hypothetical protein [Tenacibaculum ovolyticum]